MAPARIVQTRGGWPFFEVNVTAAKGNPPISQRWSLRLHRLRVRAVAVHRLPAAGRQRAVRLVLLPSGGHERKALRRLV
jgi:hypothetical protein